MNLIIDHGKNHVIDLKTLKAHLRIDHDHEDDYLKNIIEMATEILENSIGESMLQKIYKYTYYNDEYFSTKKIELPTRHVVEVKSVRKSSKNDKRELPYSVQNFRDKTNVIINDTKYPVEIQYLAGMTNNRDELPKDLKYAVLQIAKSIYDCSDNDIFESKYMTHIMNSHRNFSIN